MIIVEPLLTTFEARCIFQGSWDSSKNYLELKTKPPTTKLSMSQFLIRTVGVFDKWALAKFGGGTITFVWSGFIYFYAIVALARLYFLMRPPTGLCAIRKPQTGLRHLVGLRLVS